MFKIIFVIFIIIRDVYVLIIINFYLNFYVEYFIIFIDLLWSWYIIILLKKKIYFKIGCLIFLIRDVIFLSLCMI